MAKPMVRAISRGAAVLLPLCCSSCLHVSSDPLEVKPIHIVADVNVNVRIDRELDNFFAFQDKYQPTTQTAPTTQAAAQTTAPVATH